MNERNEKGEAMKAAVSTKNTTIHEYIMRSRRKAGVIIGTVVNGVICVGWSQTNFKAGDVFDREEGIRKALARAKGEEESPVMPLHLNRQMRDFQIRCIRYFQNGMFSFHPFAIKSQKAPKAQEAPKDMELEISQFINELDAEMARNFPNYRGVMQLIGGVITF